MPQAKVKRIVDTVQMEVDADTAYEMWAILDMVVDRRNGVHNSGINKLCNKLFGVLDFSRMLDNYDVSTTRREFDGEVEHFIILEGDN